MAILKLIIPLIRYWKSAPALNSSDSAGFNKMKQNERSKLVTNPPLTCRHVETDILSLFFYSTNSSFSFFPPTLQLNWWRSSWRVKCVTLVVTNVIGDEQWITEVWQTHIFLTSHSQTYFHFQSCRLLPKLILTAAAKNIFFTKAAVLPKNLQ